MSQTQSRQRQPYGLSSWLAARRQAYCRQAYCDFALRPCRASAVAGALAIVLFASPTIAGEPSAEAKARQTEQLQFFENEIRPLLVENCLKCHGPDKQEGSLRLDSLDAMLTGGDSGPAIEVGAAAKSLLVSAVRHEDFEMPPNKRLSDEHIDALIAWIDSGAVWPETSAGGLEIRRQHALSDEDRDYWAFRPLARITPPDISTAVDSDRRQNDIDAFIIAALNEQGLTLAPPAEPLVVLRRLYFDLVGVPPTPDEVDAYLADRSEGAYERLVDHLLDDPRYGQRWGRHWLDLVRYAESDGFKQDAYRPTAYLYRDYVIDALNRDIPYDQFVAEQIAADEISPDDPQRLAATGYLRHWIYEYNQRDVRTQWSNILNDLTDVTSEVFLGLGMGCARCHDHKFDPILQKDYYRLQATFAAFLPRDDALYGTQEELQAYRAQQRTWEEATAEIRKEMEALEQGVRERTASKAIDKFPPDVRPLLRRVSDERTPHEQQIADLAFRQVTEEWNKLDYAKQLKGADKKRWEELKEELSKFDHLKPTPPNALLAAGETGPQAPPIFIPSTGTSAEPIEPATLEVLGGKPLVAIPPTNGKSTGRRTALAAWINDPANPLPHRVIVNRVWQYHFGSGIVPNASDFGRLGGPPSHPELLDWLANWWLENGRSFKRLHKLIVQSAAYRQASQHPDQASSDLVDHENRWLWHFSARRLDAEQVRDAMLVAAGTLDGKAGGPAGEHSTYRRTIYTQVMRNKPDPILNVLDAPDGNGTVAKRSVTTTPVQSLLLVNSPWPLQVAEHMAESVRAEAASTEDQIKLAFRRCYARQPSDRELHIAMQFIDRQMQHIAEQTATPSKQENQTEEKRATDAQVPSAYTQALGDLCHVLLNSSEFLYID